MIPSSNPEKPPLESAKRLIEVDYSPEAIDRRMREFAALWDFWRYLRRFKPAPSDQAPANSYDDTKSNDQPGQSP